MDHTPSLYHLTPPPQKSTTDGALSCIFVLSLGRLALCHTACSSLQTATTAIERIRKLFYILFYYFILIFCFTFCIFSGMSCLELLKMSGHIDL